MDEQKFTVMVMRGGSWEETCWSYSTARAAREQIDNTVRLVGDWAPATYGVRDSTNGAIFSHGKVQFEVKT